MPGRFVKLDETIRGFEAILSGDCDDIPENCFMMAGGIDDVWENAKKQGAVS